MKFEFMVPTRVVFGAGVVEQAGEHAQRLGQRVCLVHGRSSARSGLLDSVVRSLNDAGLSVGTPVDVSADPTVDDVARIAATINDERLNVILAVGGGSVMDAAKAAAVLFSVTDIAAFVGKTVDESMRALPVLAVPTTAGTGSEVTKGAIITDKARGFKSGVRGTQLYPKVALIDPDVIQTMPPHVMEETLFDAFTHLFETFLGHKAQPITEALSLHGLRLIADLVTDESLNLDRLACREKLMTAALLGGINVGLASSCLPHRLQQAMGAVPEIKCSHGRGLSSVYRAWLGQVAAHAPDKLQQLTRVFGVSEPLGILNVMQEGLNMPTSLSDVGYTRQHIPQLCDSISGDLSNDPIPQIGRPLVAQVFEHAL